MSRGRCGAKNPATCTHPRCPDKRGNYVSAKTALTPKPVSNIKNPRRRAPQRDAGVNVTNFETAFVEAVVKGKGIEELNSIPDKNRPLLFRERNICQEDAESLRRAMKQALGIDDLKLTYSRSNKSGADFYEESTDTHIEIKLGAATDVNIGLERFGSVLGIKDLSAVLPNKKDKASWREMYLSNPELREQQLQAYRDRLRQSADTLNRMQSENKLALNQDLLNKMASGELNTSGDGKVIRLVRAPNNSWSLSENRKIAGEWKVEDIHLSDEYRLNIILSNDAYRFRMTLNQKNTYKAGLFRDSPAPPRHGLGNHSFNGWFTSVKE